jgi:predicted transcriptional regulator
MSSTEIRQLRLDLGVSQVELSRRANVQRATIRLLENPHTAERRRIMDTLNTIKRERETGASPVPNP